MSKMRVLIIGAMERELSTILSFYKCSEIERLSDLYPVWESETLKKYELYVLKTFVGENNASVATTLAIDLLSPDFVFKIGCVGALSKGLHTGDIVFSRGFFSTASWITRSRLDNNPTTDASLWLSLYGDKSYQVNVQNLGGVPSYFEVDQSLQNHCNNYFIDKNISTKRSYIGSGNMWIFDPDFARNISFTQIPGLSSTQAWSTDMESYAIAHACHVLHKPFMGLYRISDNYFENEDYIPEKVAQLFDRGFISIIDEYLINLVQE